MDLDYQDIEEYLERNLLDCLITFEEYGYASSYSKELILKITDMPLYNFIKEDEFIDREYFRMIYGEENESKYESLCRQPYLRLIFDCTEYEDEIGVKYTDPISDYKVVHLNPIYFTSQMQKLSVKTKGDSFGFKSY